MVTITAGTVTMIVTRPAGSEAVASVPPAARRRRMSESRVKAAGSRAGTAAPPPAPAGAGSAAAAPGSSCHEPESDRIIISDHHDGD